MRRGDAFGPDALPAAMRPPLCVAPVGLSVNYGRYPALKCWAIIFRAYGARLFELRTPSPRTEVSYRLRK